ncbi:MAG: VirB4 family type IV secretion/conjugal transfer ATPase [Proteobacteria bacterium]|nr:VirB4 family type IV secretion/conjugal transfer ATPase [Pseudomonadota bacterium]
MANDVAAAAQIPYRVHVAPSVVSTVAGDYVLAWRLSGLSFECADDVQINAAHERLGAWLRNMASPEVALWTHVIRRRERVLPPQDAPAGFASRLVQRYRRRLEQETLWSNELYVSLVYRPLGAQLSGAAAVLARRQDPDVAVRTQAANIQAASKLADQLEASLVAYDPERLAIYERDGRLHSSLLEYLALLVNGEQQPMPLPFGPIDAAIATTRTLVGWESLEYRTPDATRLGACLGIKEYPTPTFPGQLNRLLSAPFSLVLTQSFAFLPKSAAMSVLSRQYHRLRNSGDVAVSQAVALKAALDQLASNEFVLGDHHLTLQVLTEPFIAGASGAEEAIVSLNHAVAAARAILGEAGIVVAREDLALEAAYWAQLPANFAARPRRAPISSRNFAGLAPLHNFPHGRATGNHWGDALTVLKSSAGSPYHFSLHASDPRDADGGSRRDTGHTFICGPTGSGKTVFLGFCLCLLLRQGATQVVFDKDRGLEILVRALGGRYLTFRRGAPTGCNPLQLEPTPTNRAFLRTWVRGLAHRPSRPITAREEAELEQALDGALQLERSSRCLSRLLEFLDPTQPDGAYVRLSPWCAAAGGEHALIFDAPTDLVVPLLDATPILGFDMTAVIDDPEVRPPLTQYLFHLLETLLDGRRLVVWLDEFAKLVSDRGFEALASDGIKTWRKRNGVIAFATQSPSDVLRTPIARTLIEQTPTKIFFPNADASRADYIDGLGLSDREFQLIATELTPGSRRFLIKQGRESVVAELDLKGLEADLKVVSARAATVAEMEQLMATHGQDPAAWLPRFLGEDAADPAKEES